MTPVLALLLLLPAQHPDWRPDPDRDLAQFPPAWVAAELLAFANGHLCLVRETNAWLETRPDLWESWGWWEWYEERARRRAEVWASLRYASDPANGQHARDIWAAHLYGALGPADFWRGRMPAPAPFLDDIWGR